MRLIIKPMGFFVLLAMIAVMSLFAFRNMGAIARRTKPVLTVAATAAVATTPQTGEAVIYDDGLRNGWKEYGWAQEIIWNEPRFTHSPPSSIRVRFKPFDGIKFAHDALDTAPYDRVCFYVRSSEKGGQVLSVSGTRALSPGRTSELSGKSVTLELLPPDRWFPVVIPLERIGLANVPDMTSFWVSDAGGKAAVLYIDDVRLLHPGDAVPDAPLLRLNK